MQNSQAMKISTTDQNEPKDTFKIAYVIHFLLGAGNLLPWNALITAVDYFNYLYPNCHVAKSFAVAYMSSSVLVLVLVLMMSWSKWSRKLSFRWRMNMGFSVFIMSLMVMPVLDWSWYRNSLETRSRQDYEVVVLSVVMCGFADGLVGGSLMGSAGKLPKEYMQAVFAGTASSGVLVSILRIVTKASLPHTQQGLRTSAHLYFVVGTIILMACIVCCNFLYSLPVMKDHHHKLLREESPSLRPNFWAVARAIRWPAVAIFMIYTVTLSIFPGFLSENIQSERLGDWYPLMLITIYNIFDFMGKSMTAIYLMNGVRKAIWACIFRLLFYPLFTACLHGPQWLRTELPVVVLTIMLGLTNGYLTSVIMILAPKLVAFSEAEMAAVVMAVFLGIGLVSGSVLGWFWII